MSKQERIVYATFDEAGRWTGVQFGNAWLAASVLCDGRPTMVMSNLMDWASGDEVTKERLRDFAERGAAVMDAYALIENAREGRSDSPIWKDAASRWTRKHVGNGVLPGLLIEVAL